MALLLTGCSNVVIEPLENPEPELFSLLYESETYSIFERNVIEEDKIFYMVGYYMDEDYDCIFGEKDKYMYIVLYEEQYYDIFEAYKLDLYTISDLTLIGIAGECKLKD